MWHMSLTSNFSQGTITLALMWRTSSWLPSSCQREAAALQFQHPEHAAEQTRHVCCAGVVLHQQPADDHMHASQHVSQVAQQPMSQQPTAISYYHRQQLEPLAPQLSSAEDVSRTHMAETAPEVCFAATAPSHFSGTAAAPAV